MNELLTCTGLIKQYGSKTALDNLNLTLPRGRIIGLLGPNGSGKTTLLYQRVKARAEAGQRSILLVPEQFTSSTEGRIYRELGDSLSGLVESFSFTSLAEKILSTEGGAAVQTLSDAGRTVLVRRALEELQDNVHYYYRHRRSAAFCQMAAETIDELKSAGLSGQQLYALARNCGTESGKLSELALIFQGYETLLAHTGMDPADRLEEAAAQPRRTKHADAPQPAAHKPRTAAGGNGGSRKPPRDEDDAPRKAKGRKSGKKGSSGKGGNGKKKKKIRWWQILLITLLVIALIFGGAFALIMGAITPAGGNIKLNQLINTPKEFQGKEFNILVTGVDRSSTGDLSAGAANDSNVNDGMTDMILYVHFNNETGEMKMLQIPRDTMVTTDTSVSGNFRINGVAKTQGSDGNNNMAALCELVADQYKLHIDGFVTIRLEMLTELVDLFGGVEINVPMDVDYAALGLGDSVIHAGYQTLNGASMEFLLRARKIYPDGDIGRLNMQRQFYAALFRKLKSIGNIWDVAKLTPAVLNYMETNLSASELISFAISMLKIDSSKIMICQMPVISGPQYNGQSLLYPARQADADLLNQYFRENTGPVDASQLNLCDNVIDLSGYTATDPKIQQMGGLMAEADDAQKNDNLDGSNQVTDIMASESTAESESTDTDSTDTESQPAA